jgi:hypothetical protein
MFKVEREAFGLPESKLSVDWKEMARTILSEEEQQNDVKIFSLRKAVLDQEDLLNSRATVFKRPCQCHN